MTGRPIKYRAQLIRGELLITWGQKKVRKFLGVIAKKLKRRKMGV